MEETIKSLKKQGWYLSLEKIKEEFTKNEEEILSSEAENKFSKDPERWILNQDLKNVGIPCLPDKVNSGVTQITTPIVLQVKKIEVISAPQHNLESGAAPRMLKIAFTDGKTTCYGIEYAPIQKMNLKTPPGTKVRLINAVKLCNSFMLLDSKNLQILGGEVSELMEEWKIQQLLLGHVRATDQDGPPPWVPFGRKVQPINIIEKKDEKTLDEKEKAVKDEEFLNQRQDAIAAAVDTGTGINKIIKGSGRQMDIQQPERRGRGRGRRERDWSRDDEQASKPRDSIRLFEFLQPQIGADEEKEVNQEPDDHPSWERDGIYRPSEQRGSHREESYQERRGHYRERGRPHQASYSRDEETSYDRRESHRGRGDRRGGHRGRGGSYPERDSYSERRGNRGRGGSYEERDGSYSDRREGYRGRGHEPSSRGGSFRGRKGFYHQEDSYSDRRGQYQGRASSIENLVEDFAAWPELEPKEDSGRVATQLGNSSTTSKTLENWAVEDYCLAKWESTDQYYPAVIQALIPNRKSATVMFVESGAIRIVETKNLRRDPQDVGPPAPSNQSNQRPVFRNNQATRIYTPRNRGSY